MSAVVARARALVGARFRLHGRDAEHGVDCVGLAAAAFALEGVPSGYPLRGGAAGAVMAAIGGRLRVAEGRQAGDLLLMETGPGQWHLGVWTGDALIHADLGLGRVVERPGTPPWPVLGGWR